MEASMSIFFFFFIPWSNLHSVHMYQGIAGDKKLMDDILNEV